MTRTTMRFEAQVPTPTWMPRVVRATTEGASFLTKPDFVMASAAANLSITTVLRVRETAAATAAAIRVVAAVTAVAVLAAVAVSHSLRKVAEAATTVAAITAGPTIAAVPVAALAVVAAVTAVTAIAAVVAMQAGTKEAMVVNTEDPSDTDDDRSWQSDDCN